MVVTSATLHVAVTDLELVKLRAMQPIDAALALDGRLRALETVWRQGFIARGLILVEVQERQLWRHLADEQGNGYSSFDAWVCAAAPHSRRDCFAALSAVKELKDVPLAKLIDVPRCNVEVLKNLSSSVRESTDVLEAAQTLSKKEFVAKIQVQHPNQHIEDTERLVFVLTASQAAVIETTLDDVGRLMGIEDREGQLEALCADWKNERAGIDETVADTEEVSA